MGFLLHEIALESVLIALFVTRWAIEWWATGRKNRRMDSMTDELIAERRANDKHVKTELAEIKAAVKGE